jgi:short-subunit dehydrogenase
MAAFNFTGGTAVVTGAASGIGEALARGLAARGSNLVLVDRDAANLQRVASSLTDVDVDTYVVDLADPAATDHLTQEVLAAHPRIRLLVNNAGVALRGRFDQVTLDEFMWVIDINFRATVRMTHGLLPGLKAEPGAHLVNMSSLFGIIAPAGQVAYAASKFAVRGFTEAVRGELAEDGITTTCVHPGGVRTNIAVSSRTGSNVPEAERNEGNDDWQQVLTMDPAQAAAIIINGIQVRQRRVLISGTAKVLDVIARLFPSSYGSILAAAVRRRMRRQPAAATSQATVGS